jgi:hypothetical protein
MVRTLRPGSRPAHRSQLLNFPFLHIFGHPRNLLHAQPGHVNPYTNAGTVSSPEKDTESSVFYVRVSLFLNDRQNRAACHYISQDWCHNIPERHAFAFSKGPRIPMMFPGTTLAAEKIIINARLHSREVSRILGAPGREEQASVSRGTSTGAISAALLIRGHDVIHLVIVWPGH